MKTATAIQFLTADTLRALAARVVSLDNDDAAYGSVEHEEACIAYAEACLAAGYDWEQDDEAHEFAMVGAKATAGEMAQFTLPRALAALNARL